MNHLQALLNKIECLEEELERLKSIRDRLGVILEQNDLIQYIQDLSLEAAPLAPATYSARLSGPADARIKRLFEVNGNEPRTIRQIQEELSMTEYQVRNTVYANAKFERCGAKKFRLAPEPAPETSQPESAPVYDDFPGIPRPLTDSTNNDN